MKKILVSIIFLLVCYSGYGQIIVTKDVSLDTVDIKELYANLNQKGWYGGDKNFSYTISELQPTDTLIFFADDSLGGMGIIVTGSADKRHFIIHDASGKIILTGFLPFQIQEGKSFYVKGGDNINISVLLAKQ